MNMEAGWSLKGKRVWVSGHRGMVGSAIVRRLQHEDCTILTADRAQLDLRDQAAVEAWVGANRPDVALVAAGTVGGIIANSTRPAEFLYDNLAIVTNSISAAWRHGIGKLLYLGSSCVYPRLAPQPIKEEMLLTGPLEPTNQWYAVAKIAGLKQCEAFRAQYGCDFTTVIPNNLYGPADNYDPQNSHVVGALIRRIHEAKATGAPEVTLWGTGTPLREFLYVDDLADALLHILAHHRDGAPINVGPGIEHSILQLAQAIAQVAGYEGKFTFDTTKPDGMPRKAMDVTRLTALGWTATTPLHEGLRKAYAWYVENEAKN
jgi:GDP-L-fucose synthase